MIREQTVAIGPLALESGCTLPSVVQRVTFYGAPNADGSNVVLVAHALTGSSRAAEWWPGIVGPGAPFDPREWCVVGINALGSRYGSTGPTTYDGAFPRIAVGDMVRAQARALDELGIERMAFVAGGSLGGMQALQWALAFPERVGSAIVVGAHDHFSPMGVALNAVQRDCLQLDPVRGMRIARKIAMLTYKSEALLRERHGRRRDRTGADRFDVEGYLERQAGAFEARMDAATYATLTHAMDAFDVRGVEPPQAMPPVHFVGISSDWLFLPSDVRAAAARLRARGGRVTYDELRSDHGHDAFLAEDAALGRLLAPCASTIAARR